MLGLMPSSAPVRAQMPACFRRPTFSGYTRAPVSRRSCVVPRAGRRDSGTDAGFIHTFQRSCDQLLQRYDFLAAVSGALVVTCFCVAKGQDPGTAVCITATATVVALVSSVEALGMFGDSRLGDPRLEQEFTIYYLLRNRLVM